jgi:hypothetical protein
MGPDAYARWKSRNLGAASPMDISEIEKQSMEDITKMVDADLCATCGHIRGAHCLVGCRDYVHPDAEHGVYRFICIDCGLSWSCGRKDPGACPACKSRFYRVDGKLCDCKEFTLAPLEPSSNTWLSGVSKQCDDTYRGRSGFVYRCQGRANHTGRHEYSPGNEPPPAPPSPVANLENVSQSPANPELSQFVGCQERTTGNVPARDLCCCDSDIPETIGHIHEYGIICPSCCDHFKEARRIAIIQRDSQLGWKK